MTPNQVTAGRVVAAFAAVALFAFGQEALAADVAAILLTIAAIALDGVDGYIARKRNLATPLRRATGYFGRPCGGESFLHIFCGSRADFILGSGAVFCARNADRFSARPRGAQRAQRLWAEIR